MIKHLIPEGLPDVTSQGEEGGQMFLEGHLIRGNASAVRIVVANMVLELDADDVLGVEEIPETLERPLAVAVRLSVKRPVRLLSLSPADALKEIVEPQLLPFAYVTRPQAPPMQAAPRFEYLQQQFKRKFGLE